MVRPSFNSYLWQHLAAVESIIQKEEPFLPLKEQFLKSVYLIWTDYERRFSVTIDQVGMDSSEGPQWGIK